MASNYVSTTTSNTAAPPVVVPLNQDNIPDDFICSICMTVPVEPRITPCDHVFCAACISQALTQNNICPIDRRFCTHGQVEQLDGLSRRVWSCIQVKCGGHDSGCAWRGSIADYSAHTQNCTVSRASAGDTVTINSLVEQLDTANAEIANLKRQLAQAETAKQNLCAYVNNMSAEIETLQQSLSDRPDVPKLFTGHYNFDRGNVVKLSQLISRYLENKPGRIDSNRIYNCVRTCYTALEKGYSDNPEHYYMDVRMLLATCLASTWFSKNQMNSLRQWNNYFG
eukprot:scaffold7790_cov80-Skeletonema_menzelii.AAC.2